jgi:hypothetical protein
MRLPASGFRPPTPTRVEITGHGFVRSDKTFQNREPETGNRKPI